MGWRFRRRMTVFPGVRINFSSRGISTTFGVPGASINIGQSGAFLNTGIPGTGLYNRTRISEPNQQPSTPTEFSPTVPQSISIFLPDDLGAIKSKDNASITSDGLKGLKETLLAAYKEREDLKLDLSTAQEALQRNQRRLKIIRIVPFHRYLFKSALAEREQSLKDSQDDLQEVEKRLQECKVKIEIDFQPELKPAYEELVKTFEDLKTAQFKWDITTENYVDRVKTRSSASAELKRQSVTLSSSDLDFIESPFQAFKFANANGADVCLFPAFLVMYRSISDFALISFEDFNIDYVGVRFVEEETLPRDTLLVTKTWKYVNKDGSRDKRFTNNYEIPVVLYGQIHFKNEGGLNEIYQFSNPRVAEIFSKAFNLYKNAVSPKKSP